MGLHLLLEKESETEYSVTYRYDFYSSTISGSDFGIIEFDHQKESYKIIKERKGDDNHALLNRTLRAILREWKKGSFPDRTDWAS